MPKTPEQVLSAAKTFADFVSEPSVALGYLVRNDLLSARDLVPASDFAKFCKDRSLEVSVERLESLERLGIFYPLLRIRYPKIKVKIERVDATRIRNLGMLRDGEVWNGEIQEENSRLSWRPEWIGSWIDEGNAWDPREKPFVPWRTFNDGHVRNLESFYSIFQCYALENIVKRLNCNVHLEMFGVPLIDNENDEGADSHVLGKTLHDAGQATVEALRQHRRGEDAALLAQILSARYYFHTQGDQRTITVPEPDFDGWDWYEFSRKWDAKVVAKELGLAPDDVEAIHRDVRFLASINDPLKEWYELVSFIALPKRQKLKGEALLAQVGYTIEQMVRLFYYDLTGKELPLPDEGWDWTRRQKYGEGVPDNTLKHLEYLVNEYNLNPRPKAILVVEGDSEAAEIPRLVSDLYGYNLATASVEVRSLGSVDEFTGDKRVDRYGALEKLIDDYHFRQTIVFVLLDNENRASRIRDRLLTAYSRLVPKRKLTKPEYVRVWNRNFEFDNFSDGEIAAGMSGVADQRYQFSEEEVAACRSAWDVRKRDYIGKLYRDRLGYGLSKTKFVAKLVDGVLANRAAEIAEGQQEPRRPIIGLLKTILELAAFNYQPQSEDGWLANQRTGYFGDLDGDAP